jgi:hypothetical protein
MLFGGDGIGREKPATDVILIPPGSRECQIARLQQSQANPVSFKRRDMAFH